MTNLDLDCTIKEGALVFRCSEVSEGTSFWMGSIFISVVRSEIQWLLHDVIIDVKWYLFLLGKRLEQTKEQEFNIASR